MNKIQIVKNKDSLWVNWVDEFDPDTTYRPTEVVLLGYGHGKADVQDAKIFHEGGKYAIRTYDKDDIYPTRETLVKAHTKAIRALIKRNQENLRRARERAAARKIALELHLKSVERVERFARQSERK